MTGQNIRLEDYFGCNKAFMIAVEEYASPSISDLSSPVHDVTRLKEVLELSQHFLVEPVSGNDAAGQPFILENPLCNPDKHTLINFLSNITIDANDRIILYFAGHGIANDSDSDPEGYILAKDATPGEEDTFIAMSSIMAILNNLDCKHLLIILDCCYAGSFRWSENHRGLGREEVPKTIYHEKLEQYTNGIAWQVLTSSAYDQQALDTLRLGKRENQHEKQCSPFATLLIDALETGAADLSYGTTPPDGIISATELAFYLQQAIFDRLYKAGITNKTKQVPQLFPLNKHRKGEFVFINPKEAEKLKGYIHLKGRTNSNPYKGLESYKAEDSHLFYGRRRVLEDGWQSGNTYNISLAKAIETNEKVIVTGPSGIGKSSLIRAGIFPVFQQRGYTTHDIRPGKTPYSTHEARLKELANSETPSILLIDQYEELITMCNDEKERENFEKAFLHMPNTCKIIITIRSDFEAYFKHPSAYRFVVPPFSREEIREIVIQPAMQEVLEFTTANGTVADADRFINSVIDDAYQNPGSLPLLSLALSELYENRNGRSLEEAVYINFGGISGILDQKATAAFEQYKGNSQQQQLFKFLIFRMLSFEAGKIAKNRVYTSYKVGDGRIINELAYADDTITHRLAVIRQQLVDSRLLIADTDENGNGYTEPAHDALLRSWPLLLNWLKETDTPAKYPEQSKILLHHALSDISLTYLGEQDRKVSKGYLWTKDPRLDGAKKFINDRLNITEHAFIHASISEKKRIKYVWIVSIAAAVSILAIISILWFRQAVISTEANKLAEALRIASESENYGESEKLALLKQALLIYPGNQLITDKIYALLNEDRESGFLAKASFFCKNGCTGIEFSNDSRSLMLTNFKGDKYNWNYSANLITDSTKGTKVTAQLSSDSHTILLYKPQSNIATDSILIPGALIADFIHVTEKGLLYIIFSQDTTYRYRIYDEKGTLKHEKVFSSHDYDMISFSQSKDYLIVDKGDVHFFYPLDAQGTPDILKCSGKLTGTDQQRGEAIFFNHNQDTEIAEISIYNIKNSKKETQFTLSQISSNGMIDVNIFPIKDSLLIFAISNPPVEGRGGQNTTIKKINIRTRKVTNLLNVDNSAKGFQLSADSSKLLVWDEADSVYYINIKNGYKVVNYIPYLYKAGFLGKTRNYYAVSNYGGNSVLNVYRETNDPLIKIMYSGKVDSVVLSPDRRHVAVAYNDSSVHIWSAAVPRIAKPLEQSLATKITREGYEIDDLEVANQGNFIWLASHVNAGELFPASLFINGKVIPPPDSSFQYERAIYFPETAEIIVSVMVNYLSTECMMLDKNGMPLRKLTNDNDWHTLFTSFTGKGFNIICDTGYLTIKSTNNIILKQEAYTSIIRNWGQSFYTDSNYIYFTDQTYCKRINGSGVVDSIKYNADLAAYFCNIRSYFKTISKDTTLISRFPLVTEDTIKYTISEDGNYITYITDGDLFIANWPKMDVIQRIHQNIAVRYGKLFDNNRLVAFVTEDGTIKIWLTKILFTKNKPPYFYTIPLNNKIKNKYSIR